jgi:hypothetical protein
MREAKAAAHGVWRVRIRQRQGGAPGGFGGVLMPIQIAVDAMGSAHASRVLVRGAAKPSGAVFHKVFGARSHRLKPALFPGVI